MIRKNAITAHAICWFTIACAWWSESAIASPGSSLHFENISLRQGLSQVSVNTICQDRQGFMWFGTQDGLNKYDGYFFTVYRNDPDNPKGLNESHIWATLEDAQGHLWVGTDSGLSDFDPKTETFTHHHHDPDDPTSISDSTIYAIAEDSEQVLWVGTEDGLNRFDRSTKRFTRFRHSPDDPQSLGGNEIRALLKDSRGALWIGTVGGGLNRYDPSTRRFIHYQYQEDNPGSLSGDNVRALLEDSTGTLWIGTDSGLNRFDAQTQSFRRFQHRVGDPTSLSHDGVRSLLEDSKQRLWVGTHGGGLNRLDRTTGTFAHYRPRPDNPSGFRDAFVHSMFEDAEGTIWFGTQGEGILKLGPKTEAFKHYQHQGDNPESISANDVMMFVEDAQGVLWIGTYHGGLNRFDRETGTFTHYRHRPDDPTSLSADKARAVYEDARGRLWVGTTKGLNELDRTTGTFTHFRHDPQDPTSLGHDYVKTIFEDSTGTLWIGTYGGINQFDRDTGKFTRFRYQRENPDSLSHDGVYCIYEDSFNDLWIGTLNGGLNRFNRHSRTFTRFQHNAENAKSLSHDCVLSIFEDAKRNLWIGTHSGLNKMDRVTGTFSHLRTKDGLPNDVIYGILEDDRGFLWLSTNKGINKYDPRSGAIVNYDENDGLQGNEFNGGAYYEDRSGRMYFGGPTGFNVFDPAEIRDNTYVPPVLITDFLLFGKSVTTAAIGVTSDSFQLTEPISYTDSITLDYTDYIFAFEFTALSYRQPERNQYAYKLEGFDREWIATNHLHRRVTYTDLPSGNYVFTVKAANDDGHWNEQGTSIKLTILPPPWKTWWAYGLYSLALLAVIGWFIQWQRGKVKQKQKELDREKQVSARLMQLDKLKDEFLANTSHELRTPLNGIIGIAESLIDGIESWPENKIRENLGMIFSSGRRLASLVSDILDFSKMKNHTLVLNTKPVELHALVDVVLNTSRVLVGKKAITLSNEVPADLPSAAADEDRLQQILYNLLGNGIKFTESGKVAVAAAVDNNRLQVCVKDTGIGIPQNKIDRIFESFEQLEGDAARTYGGTGLGLAVTQKLVELHGGRIWVQSIEGVGSEFYFTLPISGEKAAEPTAQMSDTTASSLTARPVAPAGEPTDGIVEPAQGDFRILIVDDDPVNLQVLENHLSLRNYSITQASNGPEALELLEGNQQFDLILLDIMMPRMSGYEVAKKVRQLHAAHELPVIFLTAKNQVTDLLAAFSAGGNDYLTKPIAKAELLSRVKTHLQLMDTNRNLEQKVIDRTAELHQSLEDLKKTQALLADASRRAGMSEIAKRILHNVGNVLNSVNTSSFVVNQIFQQMQFTRLQDLVELIRQHEADLAGFFTRDEKGQHTLPYLESLQEQWTTQKARGLDELTRQKGHIDRIADIVAAQQEFVGSTGVMDTIALDLLINASLEMSDVAAAKDEIQITREFEPLPPIRGESYKLVQILIHLLNNAEHALAERDAEERRLTIRTKLVEDQRVQISVIDNGSGIPRDKLTKVFVQGFTTKPSAAGYGLHNCANSATEMGGSLTCRSDGPDQGAEFLLEIPLSPPKKDNSPTTLH